MTMKIFECMPFYEHHTRTRHTQFNRYFRENILLFTLAAQFTVVPDNTNITSVKCSAFHSLGSQSRVQFSHCADYEIDMQAGNGNAKNALFSKRPKRPAHNWNKLQTMRNFIEFSVNFIAQSSSALLSVNHRISNPQFMTASYFIFFSFAENNRFNGQQEPHGNRANAIHCCCSLAECIALFGGIIYSAYVRSVDRMDKWYVMM